MFSSHFAIRSSRFAGPLAFAALVVLANVAAASAEAVLLPGTYVAVSPATHAVLKPGNTIVFVRGKSGRLSFSLNAIRALDGNMGYVAGTLPGGGHRVTWSQTIQDANCRLTFTATATGLTVAQDANFGDCGFGYGVFADGTYARAR